MSKGSPCSEARLSPTTVDNASTGDVAPLLPLLEGAAAAAASRSFRFCEDSIFAIGATYVGLSLLAEGVVVVLPLLTHGSWRTGTAVATAGSCLSTVLADVLLGSPQPTGNMIPVRLAVGFCFEG